MAGFKAVEPSDMDAVARIGITLYGNGAMTISGNIGDAKLAMQMIDHARDTMQRRLPKLNDTILLPGSDVAVVPSAGFPLTQNADVEPDLRMKTKPVPVQL